jgi:hypothetical protein
MAIAVSGATGAAPGSAPGPVSGPSAEPTQPRRIDPTVPGSRRAARHHDLPVNIPALLLVLGGAILQLVALVDALWVQSPSGRLSFDGLLEWTVPGFAHFFFSWVAWLLLGVTLGCGIAACLRWPGASFFRYFGAIISVAGAIAAVAAVLQLVYQTSDPTFHVARNWTVGPYLEVLGLLAVALGTAAGTGRRG